MYRNGAGLALHLAAAAGNVTQLLAVYLYGGVHRGNLHDIADKRLYRVGQSLPCDAGFAAPQYIARGVLRVGAHAEAEPRDISLALRFGKFHRARRPADKHDEKSGRHRVKRSGMTYAPLTQHAFQLCRDVMARPTLRLVY